VRVLHALLGWCVAWLALRVFRYIYAPSQDRGTAAPDDRHRQGGRQQPTPALLSIVITQLQVRILILMLPTSLLAFVLLAFAATPIILSSATTTSYTYYLPFFSPPASHRLPPSCCLLPATCCLPCLLPLAPHHLCYFGWYLYLVSTPRRLLPTTCHLPPATYYPAALATYSWQWCVGEAPPHANGLLARVRGKGRGNKNNEHNNNNNNNNTNQAKPMEPTGIAIRPPPSTDSHMQPA
jgi:hypothetical protein